MALILDLPKEILMVIFKYILQTENQKYFLSSISKVCKIWESICQDSNFWHKIDGSLQIEALYGMRKNKCFLKTEELIFGPTFNLKYSKRLDDLFTEMPNLKVVNFSKVVKLDNKVLSCLKNRCGKVCSIKLPKDDVSPILLREILENHGQNLLVLDLSGQTLNLKKSLIEVSKLCLNLEEIIIEDVKSSEAFPIKEVQENCTKIRVIKSSFPVKFSKYLNKENLGFPLLEVFVYSNVVHNPMQWNLIGGSEFSDKDLKNILSKSPLLKLLDLRGCQYVSVDGILSLPATHLESLCVSMSKFCSTKRFGEVLVKWIRSLRVVDISRISSICINELLTEATERKKMANLEQLDVNNTKINAETIIKIIENCANLKSINLSSCRYVGRGCMRQFTNRSALLKLHELLLSRCNE